MMQLNGKMPGKNNPADCPNAVSKFGAFIRLYTYPCHETAVIDLINACERGDLGQVTALVTKGVDVNVRVLRYARKPLHIATEKGHSHIVKFLLTQGADKDVKNFDDSSALILAAQNGNADVIRALLETGADVKFVNKFKDTALHLVCNTGRLQPIIERLVENGADIHQSDGRDLPIHIVSRRGYSVSVEWLLENGCEIEARNKSGRTPLHEACSRGQPSVIDILLKANASCTARTEDNDETTPFLLACSNGNVKAVELLLKTGHCEVNEKNTKGEAPLLIAYKSGSEDLVRLLYEEYEARVDGDFHEIHLSCLLNREENMTAFLAEDFAIKDYDGRTALHVACSKGHLGIVRHCLAMGAEINSLDERSNSPLYLALAEQRHDVAIDLLNRDDVILDKRNGGEHTALDIVCGTGDMDLVEIVLDRLKSANPSGIPEELFRSAIVESCSSGKVEVLRTLLRNGATIKPEEEMDLILSAAENGNTEIMKVLALQGLRINIIDENENTPIHKACWNSDEDFLQCLIQYDIDIDARNSEGKTVLHLATAHGQAQSVAVLVKLGATVDAVDDNGKSPLHVACSSGREQVFTVLLQHGADVALKDRTGATALHYAAEGGNISIIRTLLRNGADVHARDEKLSTPLHYACLKGYFYAACTLIEHGANVNSQDADGRTALHVICERLFESPYVRRYVKFTDVPCDRTYVELTEILLQAGADASLRDHENSFPISVILRRLSGLPEGGGSSRVLFADEVSNSLFALLLDSYYPQTELSDMLLAQLYAKVGKPVMLLLLRAGCALEKYPNSVLLQRLVRTNDLISMRLLHEAGYQISERQLREATAGVDNAEHFIVESLKLTKTALRLKDLSRIILRSIFRRRPGRMTSLVDNLPIPLQLKDYLTMYN